MEALLHQLTAQQRALQQRRHQTWPMRTGDEEGLLTAADHTELLNVWQVKWTLSDVLSVKHLSSASSAVFFFPALTASSLSSLGSGDAWTCPLPCLHAAGAAGRV